MGVVNIPGQSSVSSNTHYALSVVVPHNLGFAPIYMLFAYVPALDWYGTQLYNQILQMPQGIQDNSANGSNGNFYNLGMLSDNKNLTIYNNAYTHSVPTAIPAIPVTYILMSNYANQ